MGSDRKAEQNKYLLANRRQDLANDLIDQKGKAAKIKREILPFYKEIMAMHDDVKALMRRGKIEQVKKRQKEIKQRIVVLRDFVHQEVLLDVSYQKDVELVDMVATLDRYYGEHCKEEEARKLKLEISGTGGGPIETKASLNQNDRKLLRTWAKKDVKRKAK